MLRAFSYGGGVQSTAALVLASRNMIDYQTFLFANVGDDSEHPDTLEYVRSVAMPFAKEHNLDLLELHRVKRDGKRETLYEHLQNSRRSIPIPVRRIEDGAPGTRSCTATFKMKVVYRWQREHGATKENPAVCGIGISADEAHRARTDSGFASQLLDYPLLDQRINRTQCKRIIEDAGLPVPPKSACYFCPFHALPAWVKMHKDRPDLSEKAMALEEMLGRRREALGKDPMFFTRYGKPLRDVLENADKQEDIFDYDGPETCDSGHCWT